MAAGAATAAAIAALLAVPAAAEPPRDGMILPPQVSGLVSDASSDIGALDADTPFLQASLRTEQPGRQSAPRDPFLPKTGPAAASLHGLNVGAPAEPGRNAQGLAFDPALSADAAAAEARMGPIERPSPLGLALKAALRRADPALRRAYEAADYTPVFIAGPGATRKAEALLAAIGAADRHALPVARYGADKLKARLEAAAAKGALADPKQAAALELVFAKTYLLLARDVSGGALRPRDFGGNFDFARPKAEAGPLLLAARRGGDMTALIDAMAPQTRDYQRLLVVYAALRDISEHKVWPAPVAGSGSLRPFDRGERVDALRARLVALGDLDPMAPRSVHPETGEPLFDAAVESGVRAFQERHGLAVDGVVGANTLQALNASAKDRALQAAVNLERARWHNMPLGERHVQVNIPDFHVDVMERGVSIYRSRVVVGARRHQTPEFSDEMTHVIVNPYWNVPYSIATEELLPQLQEVPGVLKTRNIHVYDESGEQVDPWTVNWTGYGEGFFPFRLRQDPGGANALGDVKFIFPNHHAVYLHDTPSKSLFVKSARALSHGCIRVAEPQRLAKTLLSPQMDDPAAYYASLAGRSRERHVAIEHPVPVHLLYRTAWVDERGRLQLREDVYGRDARVGAALKKAGWRL